MSACHFGLSYSQQAGGVRGEIPTIPDFLTALADRVALQTKMPTNYVQCHRADVTGHRAPADRDPSGMIVPMLTLGTARTFRVGGVYDESLLKYRLTGLNAIAQKQNT